LDPVARLLPALRSVALGDAQLLPGKPAALFDIRLQQWLRVEYLADPEQNEKVAARSLIASLPIGSLILADLGYFGFAWFDDLTRASYYWVSRLRAKTSYRVLHTFYEDGTTFDGIVWLGAYRTDQAAFAVRLVRYQHQHVSYRYLTNGLDPTQLSLHDLAYLYARRWDIEPSIRFRKQHLSWTLPAFQQSELCDRWIWLTQIAFWCLFLARPLVADCRLPWQKPVAALTPARVKRAYPALFSAIGTPAAPPQTRGKSPGWPTGKIRQPKKRYKPLKRERPRAKMP
jgi:hypothetical protein